MADPAVPQPLDGIRVVDMTTLGMGPLAGQLLGDFGADVIKLEIPTGDNFRHIVPQRSPGMSHTFMQFNRNKRSIALDLKSTLGSEAKERLLRTADVVLVSVRAEAARSLGMDYDSIRAINSNVIYCAAYGYSEKGPYAGRPAADDTIQAMSGLAGLQQLASGSNQLIASVIADKACGQAIVYSVMAALIHRMKTGQGQAIEVPMFETMVAFVMPEHMAGKSFEPPMGEAGYARVINKDRRPFRTKDGWLCVLPYTTAQWLRFLKMIGRDDMAANPDLSDPVYRSRHYEELYGLIDGAMPQRTTAEWVELLLDADILFGEVKGPNDLLTDPHLAAMSMFPVVEHPSEGTIRLLGFPVSLSETPNTLRRLPPRLGEHNREILGELGFTSDEVAAMTSGEKAKVA